MNDLIPGSPAWWKVFENTPAAPDEIKVMRVPSNDELQNEWVEGKHFIHTDWHEWKAAQLENYIDKLQREAFIMNHRLRIVSKEMNRNGSKSKGIYPKVDGFPVVAGFYWYVEGNSKQICFIDARYDPPEVYATRQAYGKPYNKYARVWNEGEWYGPIPEPSE